MKNILITGIGGFVGGMLAKRLVDQGYEVTGIVQDQRKYDNLAYLGIRDKVNTCRGSVTDYEFVARLLNQYSIDTVFHLAAVSIVRHAAQHPTTCFEANIKGTWTVLEACRIHGGAKAILVASSDKAYGEHKTLPYTEDFALKACHTYDASKACEDIIGRTYAVNYDLPVVVSRSSNIYGPGDFNFSRIIPNTIRRALHDESPIIWKGVHDYVREFIYIEDVIDAMLALVKHIGTTKGEAYNFAGLEHAKVYDIVRGLLDAMGKQSLEIKTPEREGMFLEIKEQYMNGDKIHKATGWLPKVNLNKGLGETIRWYEKLYKELEI